MVTDTLLNWDQNVIIGERAGGLIRYEWMAENIGRPIFKDRKVLLLMNARNKKGKKSSWYQAHFKTPIGTADRTGKIQTSSALPVLGTPTGKRQTDAVTHVSSRKQENRNETDILKEGQTHAKKKSQFAKRLDGGGTQKKFS